MKKEQKKKERKKKKSSQKSTEMNKRKKEQKNASTTDRPRHYCMEKYGKLTERKRKKRKKEGLVFASLHSHRRMTRCFRDIIEYSDRAKGNAQKLVRTNLRRIYDPPFVNFVECQNNPIVSVNYLELIYFWKIGFYSCLIRIERKNCKNRRTRL